MVSFAQHNYLAALNAPGGVSVNVWMHTVYEPCNTKQLLTVSPLDTYVGWDHLTRVMQLDMIAYPFFFIDKGKINYWSW